MLQFIIAALNDIYRFLKPEHCMSMKLKKVRLVDKKIPVVIDNFLFQAVYKVFNENKNWCVRNKGK